MNKKTALWYAASVGNVNVVEILLENGAIMDDRDEVEKNLHCTVVVIYIIMYPIIL